MNPLNPMNRVVAATLGAFAYAGARDAASPAPGDGSATGCASTAPAGSAASEAKGAIDEPQFVAHHARGPDSESALARIRRWAAR